MSKFSFDTEVLEQDTAADKAANRGKFFQEPGQYDVTLSVESDKEKDEPNAHWNTLTLKLTDDDGRSCKHFIDYPTTSNIKQTSRKGNEHYNGYISLKKTFVGFGMAEEVGSIAAKDLATLVPLAFTDTDANFEGARARVTLGWKDNTVHPESRDGHLVLVCDKGEVQEEVEKIKLKTRLENGEEDPDCDGQSWKDAREALEAAWDEVDSKLYFNGFLEVKGLVLEEPIKAKKKKGKGLF